MKVVHVIKRVEMIDNDIKELKKLEKSLARDKSFSTPIYMTIEKQINILLDERIKLLGLKIDNPPQYLVNDVEGEAPVLTKSEIQIIPEPKKTIKKPKPRPAGSDPENKQLKPKPSIFDDDEIPMLTQDQIDAKIHSLKSEIADNTPNNKPEIEEKSEDTPLDDKSIKLLDVALEKGSLNKKIIERSKKVKFFRENFPSD